MVSVKKKKKEEYDDREKRSIVDEAMRMEKMPAGRNGRRKTEKGQKRNKLASPIDITLRFA